MSLPESPLTEDFEIQSDIRLDLCDGEEKPTIDYNWTQIDGTKIVDIDTQKSVLVIPKHFRTVI